MLVLNDLRFAVRTLRHNLAFTGAAVATFGLAIGASTAIFSVVDATLLRPLPFRTPDRLAVVWGVAGQARAIRGGSFPEVADWARLNRTFESVSYWDVTSLNLRTDKGADRINAEMVSASYFPMVGGRAELGRVFTPAEDAVPGAYPVIVISHNMWTTRFGGDSSLVGRTVTINDLPFRVIGVMPEGFRGLSFTSDMWFPAAMAESNGSGPLTNRGSRWLGAVGRLKDGVTLEAAQADMERVAGQLTAAFPETNTDRSVQLFDLRSWFLGPTRGLILAVFAAVGLLLLIACTNVVGLQLVRSAGRRREFALRVAIGAEKGRLVQQLVIEGMVLAFAAAVVGLIVGWWGLHGLVAMTPAGLLPGYATPEVNTTAFVFAILVAGTCGVLFGLLPALRNSRLDLSDALREGGRGTAVGFGRGRRLGSNQIIIVAEAAVTVVLLIGAGLFVRSLKNELQVRPGFDSRGLTEAQLVYPASYDAAARIALAERLRDRLAAQPGVRGVTTASDMPLNGQTGAGIMFAPDVNETFRYYRHAVEPGFFRTMGIPIVAGRAFDERDRTGAEAVVMISESMAKRFWRDQSPIGRRIRAGGPTGTEFTIAGVVADIRYRDLRTPLATTEPDVYFPFAQRPLGQLSVALRSNAAPGAVAELVRRELAALDPTIPLFAIQSVDLLIEQQTASGRFGSTLLTVFGIAALLLTAVGLYGVLAFLVSLRRREIGVRIALGATHGRILAGIVGHGVTLVAVGVTAGLGIAAFATRWMAPQLFGVGGHDFAVFAVVPLVLVGVTLIASWVPATRAARVHPMETLRSD